MQINPEWFHNKVSYEAFLYAAEIATKLQKIKETGAFIFDGSARLEGNFVVRLEDTESCVGYKENNSTTAYCGLQWDSKSGKIWCTKKEVKEAFSGIRYVNPKDAKKIV